jgi:hypothetical protein
LRTIPSYKNVERSLRFVTLDRIATNGPASRRPDGLIFPMISRATQHERGGSRGTDVAQGVSWKITL